MNFYNLRKRVPNKSEILAVFYLGVFLFHLWSISVFLYEVPGMLFYMNLWELTQVIAYNQALALLECIIFTLSLVCLSSLLPERLFKAQFVNQGVFIILLTTIGSILFNRAEAFVIKILPVWIEWVNHLKLPSISISNLMTSDTFLYNIFLFVLFTTWLSIFAFSPFIVRRFNRFRNSVLAVAERVSVLSWMFVVVDVFGLVIVIINNIH